MAERERKIGNIATKALSVIGGIITVPKDSPGFLVAAQGLTDGINLLTSITATQIGTGINLERVGVCFVASRAITHALTYLPKLRR